MIETDQKVDQSLKLFFGEFALDAATRELIEAASDRQQGLQQEVPEHETARGGAAQEGGTKRAAAEGDGSEPEVAKEVQKKKPKVALSFADDDVEDDSDLL